jgi:EAL domain-containing protein (putative c-di-GMP-specific phosphodiesterase class I)
VFEVFEVGQIQIFGGADEHAVHQMDDLKRLGVMISIDDFGTGYSFLSYLKRIPADFLKVDQSFMKGLVKDVVDHKLERTIIDLAHTFGMEATAEGVESAEQASFLREMGCEWDRGITSACRSQAKR